MAATEAEAQAQLVDAIDLLETLRASAEDGAGALIALEDAAVQAAEGEYSVEYLESLRAFRQGVRGSLNTHAQMLVAPLQHWGRAIDSRWVNPLNLQGLLDDIYDRMIASGDRISSRQVTYDTPSAGGSNVGSGTLLRLTVDEEGLDLENCHTELKTAECVGDQSTGTDRHEELFALYGGTAGRDALELLGSGRAVPLRALTPRVGGSVVQNPSFDVVPTASALQGWEVTAGSIADLAGDTTNFYRGYRGVAAPAGLELEGNVSISQKLSNLGKSLNAAVPYYLQLVINRLSTGADGTLTIRLGATSKAFTLSSLAASGFVVCRLDVDEGLYYDNFREDELDVSIELAGGSTFGAVIDDVILAPMTPFDGSWWALVGGATPFLRDDVFTMTDTEAATGIVQRWLWRAAGRYLPAATGMGITIADPS